MNSLVVDICKMPFSDAEVFLRVEFSVYNVMSFEFVSDDIDVDFQNLVSMLKGWYSAFLIQKSSDAYLKVTFVTKVNPALFLRRLSKLCNKRGGIQYV